MLKNLSIRKKLIYSMLLICLIPFVLSTLYIKGETEKWLYQNSIDQQQTVLEQVAQHIDGAIFSAISNMTSMLVLNEDIQNVDQNINNYTNYNPDSYVNTKTENEKKITKLFKSIVDTHSIITFISYGTEFGGYIEYPAFKPNAPYDPRVRNWYINALKNDSVLISEPYETSVTKETVISVDKKVVKNDKVIGVVSLTINLENIMNDISSVKIGDTGNISIVSPENVIINNSEDADWLLQRINGDKKSSYEGFEKFNNHSFEGMLNGEKKVVTEYISPISKWKYIAIVSKNEILEQSQSLSSLLFVITLFIALIVILFVFLISNYISKPILTLSRIIKKMATFNFDEYEHDAIDQFSKSNDEIGKIAKALSGMQLNFLELRDSLDFMDEEIRSIKVDESSIKRLKLSKSNPFKEIAHSINGLLDKVSSYIEKIREKNEEISFKNKRLVSSEVELKAQLEEINSQQKQISFLADHDPLTNLPNRRSFHSKLSDSLLNNIDGAVILIDLDNFKSINDTLGHIFGDKVLLTVASKLSTTVKEHIFISRFGGDEFLILFENLSKDKDLDQYIKTLISLFERQIVIDDHEIKIEFSMGISKFPDDSTSFEQIIMNADLALYHVKDNGKKDFAYFDQKMALLLKKKLEIQNMLQYAIDFNGFKMVYQPQINLASGKITGYEALLRLKAYKLSPSEFIPIAEASGLIIPIGRKVTYMVIEQIAFWLKTGINPKPVAINFSVLQINDLNYMEFLFETLAYFGVRPEYLQIEITEHIFLENKLLAIAFMTELRAKGIKIAIDDFGAEYSSLSYLATLPIDILKFDREMNLKLLNLGNSEVIDKLIAFVHALNLKIIAEGIEELNQVKILQNSKCDEIQGAYFSKPLEADQIMEINDKRFSF